MIKEVFSIFEQNRLKVKFRLPDKDIWQKTLDRATYIPVFYTNEMIDYQLEYQKGNGGDWMDISVTLIWDNKYCGLWPLTLSKIEDEYFLSSQGGKVLPPIFIEGVVEKSQKKIIDSCLNVANEICKSKKITQWESSEINIGSVFFSNWHLISLNNKCNFRIQYELFVNLTSSMDEIKNKFRSSYKSLINQGARLWEVSTLNFADRKIWAEFKNLHFAVSGRKTRSDKCWEIQYDDIVNKKAFLLFLRDPNGTMIGGGFFYYSKDEGLYAVGVYDRELFDQPIGHIVQFKAMEHLKYLGVKMYRIGAFHRATDIPNPTDKEISIGYFKKGFSTHVYPNNILQHTSYN
jgi:FemAB family protein